MLGSKVEFCDTSVKKIKLVLGNYSVSHVLHCIIFTVLFLQIMKSEIMRINHEQQAMKEKIKVTSISALLELKFRIYLTFYVRSGIIIQTKVNNAILFT